MKNIFLKGKFLFVLCLMVLVLAACGSDDSANSKGDSDKKVTVNIAYGNQPGEPVDQLAKKWKELAEEKSDGRLELVLYPSSQLGSEKDSVEQAIMGGNVVIFTGYDFLMDYVPDAGILTAPYLTDNFEDLFYLTTTDWFADLEKSLNEKGIDIVTTNTLYGARQLMTTKPVQTPADLKGLKIRVPNNQMYIKTFEALGAAPTPMPLADLYTSLQQGLVDGAENPLPTLAGTKTNEVAKNLALTSHTKIMSPWIAGTKFTETIPADLLEILRETGDEAGEWAKLVVDEESEKVLEEFKAQGVNITEVDESAFREATKSVYKAFPSWSDGLYETIQKLVQEK